MGRKKGAPVNTRAIWVYLESPKIAEEWKKESKKNGVSTSTFVKEIVERHLATKGVITSRGTIEDELLDATKKIRELRGENIELNKKLGRQNTLLDRYEEQIRNLQNEKFQDNGTFEGIREFEEKLIDLLKEKKQIKEEKILDFLHIKPTDNKNIKAIDKQIEILLNYGLIKRYKGGYLWQG